MIFYCILSGKLDLNLLQFESVLRREGFAALNKLILTLIYHIPFTSQFNSTGKYYSLPHSPSSSGLISSTEPFSHEMIDFSALTALLSTCVSMNVFGLI